MSYPLAKMEALDPQEGWLSHSRGSTPNRRAGAGDESVSPMLYHHARPPMARIMAIDEVPCAGGWPNTVHARGADRRDPPDDSPRHRLFP